MPASRSIAVCPSLRSSTPRLAAVMLTLLGAFALPDDASAQSVPGYQVSTYADVPNPALFTFGPGGEIYIGRDPVASGSATPQFVHRIGVGGAPVTQLGNVPISDPDTVLLDTSGTTSGVPGTLIVSGLLGTSGVGRISGIRPDGNVVTLWDTGPWANVVEMKFDLNGRLLFTGAESRSIWSSTGGAPPTILATLPGSAYPTYLTIGADNRIVVGGSDGVVRVYSATGTLLNGSLTTFGGLGGLEFGQGGAFGSELHAIDTVAGTLVRVSATGVKTTIGTGFATGFSTKDIGFGPNGNLFVSVNTASKLLVISSPWSSLGCALPGVAGAPLFAGVGSLAGGSANGLDLAQAAPSAPAGLFVALTSGALPFKGGTLKPSPFFSVVLLNSSPAGTIGLPFTMPAGVPAGTSLVLQWAIKDVAAVQGVALSNGLKGVTP